MKWLLKMGVHPTQISKRKKILGSPNELPNLKVESNAELSNTIPANGTKKTDISKTKFSRENYTSVPAYNKGPYMVVSKSELKNGAGRK